MDNEKNTEQQKRLPIVRRLEMIEEFHRSSLTRREFAKQHDVARSTLDYWIRKARKDSFRPAPVLFNEIKFPNPMIPTSNGWAMEIISPSGVTIRYREALSTSDLIQVLTEA
jgi:hypothetical protein